MFRAFLALRSCSEGDLLESHGEADWGPTGFLANLASWLRAECRDPAELGGHGPDVAATLLYGICHGFFVRWLARDAAGRIADETDRIIDFTFLALTGATRRPASRPRSRSRPRHRS